MKVRIQVQQDADDLSHVELVVNGERFYMTGEQATSLGESLLNAGVNAKLTVMGYNPAQKLS